MDAAVGADEPELTWCASHAGHRLGDAMHRVAVAGATEERQPAGQRQAARVVGGDAQPIADVEHRDREAAVEVEGGDVVDADAGDVEAPRATAMTADGGMRRGPDASSRSCSPGRHGRADTPTCPRAPPAGARPRPTSAAPPRPGSPDRAPPAAAGTGRQIIRLLVGDRGDLLDRPLDRRGRKWVLAATCENGAKSSAIRRR